ncbi:MAG TPA: C40 family peptidase [Trebonia sp.]|jgi:cell wall-associated NlpC family hydrolase|nr:C40 family peptidase [Trebonia sp.]
MRRVRLAHAAVTALMISVPVAGAVAGTTAAASAAAARAGEQKPAAATAELSARHQESFNQKVATYVKLLEGVPYVWGGTTPAGFDCSGLTQYVYRHFGRRIPRTAEEQFLESRPISKSRVWGGDLVFFHVDSDPDSYVYHVGVYEGGYGMVAASFGAGMVIGQSYAWGGDTVTFGTFTH